MIPTWHILLKEKSARAMSVAHDGKGKSDVRTVAASPYISSSAAAVITSKINGGNVQTQSLGS
jgi:hypothetical protein